MLKTPEDTAAWTTPADIGPMDPRVMATCESAFRRGYSQGASAALQAVIDAVDEQALDAWLDRLDRWRAGFRDGFELPPAAGDSR